MKLEFCPDCAGIDIKKEPNGSSKCKRCGFVGEMRYGAMDEINALKTRLNSTSATASEVQSQQAVQQKAAPKDYNNPLKQKLRDLKGKKTVESDFL